MRSNVVRRNATKILASVGLVAGAAMVAGVGTFGAYTDTTTADTSVASGVVDVEMNGSDTGVSIDVSGMVPGDTRHFPVTISRGADSVELGDLSVITSAPKNALTDHLVLAVDRCSREWVAKAGRLTCPSGWSFPVYIGDNSMVVDSVNDDWWTRDWITALNDDKAIYLRAKLTLLPSRDGTDTSGMAANLAWTVTGTQRTGEESVVTPTPLP